MPHALGHIDYTSVLLWRHLLGKICLQSLDKRWLVYVLLIAFTAEACFTESLILFFIWVGVGNTCVLGQWKGDASWEMGNGQLGAKPGVRTISLNNLIWGISWPTAAGEASLVALGWFLDLPGVVTATPLLPFNLDWASPQTCLNKVGAEQEKVSWPELSSGPSQHKFQLSPCEWWFPFWFCLACRKLKP